MGEIEEWDWWEFRWYGLVTLDEIRNVKILVKNK